MSQGFAEANDGETEAEEGGGILGIGKERRGGTSHIGKHKMILPLKGQFCEECTEVIGWPICHRRIEDRGDQSRARYYLDKINSNKNRAISIYNYLLVSFQFFEK